MIILFWSICFAQIWDKYRLRRVRWSRWESGWDKMGVGSGQKEQFHQRLTRRPNIAMHRICSKTASHEHHVLFRAGVVGFVDLTSQDVEKQIEEFTQNRKFVGARKILDLTDDPRWLEREDVIDGMRVLQRHNLTYDLLVSSQFQIIIQRKSDHHQILCSWTPTKVFQRLLMFLKVHTLAQTAAVYFFI